MKKLFAFISILAVASAAMFADLSVKKNADGSYEATFFYGNPRATEVLLAGNFTDWQNGALPMEKGEKGFSITKTFPASTEKVIYKFISDGNWTTDLKAPEFVDDGFGGKNSQGVLAELAGGDDAGAAGKAKINFVSWSMIGMQANYLTQGKGDATKKGMDLDSVTIGFKSYDKFAGNFLPNCPVYIEVALAETDIENYNGDNELKYLYKKNAFDDVDVDWDDGFKELVNGLVAAPVEYLAQSNDNSGKKKKGPGSNPFLGHLKFGFNTPYVNFVTGFNYAKPEVRQAITWTTVDGHWDAGYEHVGGFNVFSLGDKTVAFLEEKTGVTFDIGFAPNKTADRKGRKFGYWAWADAKINDLVIDFQSNGMYNGDEMFSEPVEHDFILGAKDVINTDAGKIKFAVQGLISTHQKDSDEIVAMNTADGAENPSVHDYFGYSTDVVYRTGDFDGIRNIAANAKVGFENDTIGVNVEYLLRGAQASMLYLRENHDDGTFDLTETLGNLNSQKVVLGVNSSLMDGALSLGLKASAKMPLEDVTDLAKDGYVQGWTDNYASWYVTRCSGNFEPVLAESGAEFSFTPTVGYNVNDNISVSAYADMKYNALKDAADYSYTDSKFGFKLAGVTANIKTDSDVLKSVDVYYGLDNQNAVRMLNTLIGSATFAGNIKATAAVGLKTIKSTDAAKASEYDADSALNNPFAFALGVAKKFESFQKPTLYAQFVYNMDPYAHFGSGQDNLNLDRANMNGSWEKEGVGSIDPVDWYDGRAAMRVGIRWDI